MIFDTILYVSLMIVFALIIHDIFKQRHKTRWDWDRNTLGSDRDKVISSFAAVEATRRPEDRGILPTRNQHS